VKYISLLVFTAGAATLGVELSAARLLEPAFGNNQIVWAALIGMILFYLAIGAWLGGKLADRFPHRRGLEMTITLAALGIALVPACSTTVLRWAARGLDSFSAGLLIGAMLAVLLLFSLPVILLGTVSPWAVRLAVTDLQQSGATAGRLYAIATAGSLVGTFLPVLWLIPSYGTRWTFYLLAMALLIVVAVCANAIVGFRCWPWAVCSHWRSSRSRPPRSAAVGTMARMAQLSMKTKVPTITLLSANGAASGILN